MESENRENKRVIAFLDFVKAIENKNRRSGYIVVTDPKHHKIGQEQKSYPQRGDRKAGMFAKIVYPTDKFVHKGNDDAIRKPENGEHPGNGEHPRETGFQLPIPIRAMKNVKIVDSGLPLDVVFPEKFRAFPVEQAIAPAYFFPSAEEKQEGQQ